MLQQPEHKSSSESLDSDDLFIVINRIFCLLHVKATSLLASHFKDLLTLFHPILLSSISCSSVGEVLMLSFYGVD